MIMNIKDGATEASGLAQIIGMLQAHPVSLYLGVPTQYYLQSFTLRKHAQAIYSDFYSCKK